MFWHLSFTPVLIALLAGIMVHCTYTHLYVVPNGYLPYYCFLIIEYYYYYFFYYYYNNMINTSNYKNYENNNGRVYNNGRVNIKTMKTKMEG